MITQASPERFVVLFGGQGSPSIFSSHAATAIGQDLQLASAGRILLSRCHAAFLEEVACLDDQSGDVLDIDLSSFSTPHDLLEPAVQYHQHPVLQAATIYLCQLLHYVAEAHRHAGTYERFYNATQETAGFSSGIIPAAVVARSGTLDDLVNAGVEGFRLAIWIACRSTLWILKSTNNDSASECKDSDATLSLVIRGVSTELVAERLSKHFSVQSSKTKRELQISAVSTSGDVSVSGPKQQLSIFKAQAIPDVATTFAFVHGWYHGGDQLAHVVHQVVEDSKRRGFSLPACPANAKPIRSTLDGTLFGSSEASSEDLLMWLTRHLLVHPVNWHDTSHHIALDTQEFLEREKEHCMTILSIGPSSAMLFPSIQPQHTRMKMLDLSPFKQNEKEKVSSNHKESIAIVGMGIHLPKGRGQEELWETLSQGLNAVNEIPETRFKVSDYNADNFSNPRTMKAQHGAFIQDPFSFDNTFFNISPREAKSMDPQQRILLQVAQMALDDAGYVEDSSPSFQRGSTGCYIGLATGDYVANLHNDIDVFYSCGTLRAFHSGRISYFYKLSGPSLVTDTACSSSMVSIYQACRALQNGDCTAAIAGGVNVITSPDMYLGLDRGHFLSPTGSCKPFDATADGYCRAEGCVLFVLKRLSDAVAEGDRVHGVIRGVVINQSGNSHSITHPHSQTQSDLLKRLLQKAKVDPSSVGVVEAHGTGTQAGDAREIESLRNVFGASHSTSNPLMISSIKGNIGHCEAASGAAGLAKLLLMLRERKIPGQVGLNTINPIFSDLEDLGFTIPRNTMQWNHSLQTPRRALINNFGAAGSNASLLLEDWVECSLNRHQNEIRSAYVFALSAKTEEALRLSVDEHIAILQQVQPEQSLRDICYTATARRHVYDHRISLICHSVEDLIMKLQNQRIYKSTPLTGFRYIGFIFSGQGALHEGMGQELFDTFPPFRESVMQCDEIVRKISSLSIIRFLTSKENIAGNLSSTEHIITSQCACIALEYALATIFISWGLKPDYVMGHSLGEYAALCVSGVLSLEDTFRVVASRARMMTSLCPAEDTAMLACQISSGDAETLISINSSLAGLTIACHNGAKKCVVGGPILQLGIFQNECKLRNIKTTMLEVPYAFHTSAMDPILEPLEVLGQSIRFGRPQIPVISNTFGRQLVDEELSGNYFALHARMPVRFFEGLMSLRSRNMLNDGLLLEIGPHPTMIQSIRESNLSNSCLSLGTLKKGKDAWTSISETLAAIFYRRNSVEWRKVFDGSQAKVTSLPGHPLKGPVFLVPFQESDKSTQRLEPNSEEPMTRRKTDLQLLPWHDLSKSTKDEMVFETGLGILGPLITGHDVGGTPICPASLFYELAMEAAQTLLKPFEAQTLVINGMDFVSPLVYVPSSVKSTVIVRVTRCEKSSAAYFKITSISIKGLTELLHCTGTVSMQDVRVNAPQWMKDQALVKRQSNYFSGLGKNFMSSFRTKILYEAIFARVVKYSLEYRTLVELKVADSKLEGIGTFRLPSTSIYKCLTNPIFTDTLLHAAGFIANIAVSSDEIGICSKVESIEMLYRQIDHASSFTVYCSLLEVEGSIIADSFALSNSGDIIATVRGMEFRRLKLAAFQNALSRNTSSATSQVIPSSSTARCSNVCDTLSEISGPLCEPRKVVDNLDDSMRQLLKEIVSEVGGFSGQDLDFEKPMDELGIDSLIQIEIVTKLKQKFPEQSTLDHGILYNCNTLQDVESALKSSIQVSSHQGMLGITQDVNSVASSQPTPVLSDCGMSDEVPRNPSPIYLSTKENAPLCLFHDGSGQTHLYGSLPKYERSTYAFFDPTYGLAYDQRPHSSVQQLAGRYVSLLTHLKKVPLILGDEGWSFGGIVAYEAAQQLVTDGFIIKGLVLIDSPSPVNHEPLPTALITHLTRPIERLHASRSSTDLEDEFLFNASLLKNYNPRPFLETQGRALRATMLKSTEVLDTQKLCNVRYDWLNCQDSRTTAISAWKELVGCHVELFQIPGNHFEPFNKENVNETTRQLWKACEYIENGPE